MEFLVQSTPHTFFFRTYVVNAENRDLLIVELRVYRGRFDITVL